MFLKIEIEKKIFFTLPGPGEFVLQSPAAGLKNSQLHVEADPPTPTSIKS